jgi:hypothetical protein
MAKLAWSTNSVSPARRRQPVDRQVLKDNGHSGKRRILIGIAEISEPDLNSCPVCFEGCDSLSSRPDKTVGNRRGYTVSA